MKNRIALEAHRIRHSHAGDIVADDISLQVRQGEILALLGPNGAGKSTLLEILAGMITPDGGSVRIGGEAVLPATAAIRRIGYLPAKPALYDDLTVGEQLRHAARLYGLGDAASRIAEVIGLCDLGSVADKRIGHLSKGFRQRAGLAQALLHRPPVLLLDEPGDGLDPAQTMAFHALLRSLQEETAVVICSHDLAEVKALASHVLLMHQGRQRLFSRMQDLGEPLERIYLREILGADDV